MTSTAALRINEVAPRDGLQMESRFVPTDDKVAFVDALSDCGFARIEVTSFVSARAIPALADAEAVMRRIRRAPGVTYTALVPNLRGLERALESGCDALNLVMSCSESHNKANLRMTREESARQLERMIREATEAGVACAVSLSVAFGCPFEGEVPVQTVADLAARFVDCGAADITLCDTTGMADPIGTARLLRALGLRLSADRLTIHLHNTRGMALANAVAAHQEGVRSFDAACSGLGGCPYAPGASGNVGTEELVHMFQCMGFDCGVDLALLLEVSKRVPHWLERYVPNQILAAGPRSRLHPRPLQVS